MINVGTQKSFWKKKYYFLMKFLSLSIFSSKKAGNE